MITKKEFTYFLETEDALQEYRQLAGTGNAADSQEEFDDCPKDCLIIGAFDFGPKFDSVTGKANNKFAKWSRITDHWDSYLKG